MKADVNRHKILLLESSDIIREGLIRILSDAFSDIHIISLSVFKELEQYPNKKDVALILLNPGIIPGCINSVAGTLEKFQAAKTVGIINRIYDRDQSLLFDDLIFINDRRENICRIIKNNLIVVSSRESPNKKLSRRELDVLKLLVKGYANRQIADELFISIHTVITHRRNISRKLGIKSIAGLAIYSVINNIIDIDDYLNNIQ